MSQGSHCGSLARANLLAGLRLQDEGRGQPSPAGASIRAQTIGTAIEGRSVAHSRGSRGQILPLGGGDVGQIGGDQVHRSEAAAPTGPLAGNGLAPSHRCVGHSPPSRPAHRPSRPGHRQWPEAGALPASRRWPHCRRQRRRSARALPFCCAIFKACSTSSSVSGRGISTRESTTKSRSKNSR